MNVPEIMEQRPLVERLARHLAAGAVHNWPYWVEDATNILALMKEPDQGMRDAGDATTWQAMIDAALRQRWTIFPPESRDGYSDGDGSVDGAAGTDEEGEIHLPPDRADANGSAWVHIEKPSEEAP